MAADAGAAVVDTAAEMSTDTEKKGNLKAETSVTQ